MQIIIDLFLHRLKNIGSKSNYISYNKVEKNYTTEINNNYKDAWVETSCLCENTSGKDILLSTFDRHGADYETVICTKCGLIRANKYFLDKNLINFYKNDYRRLTGKQNPIYKYSNTLERSKRTNRYSIIKKFLSSGNKTIFDIGGAAGGFLDPFIENNQVYLFDYNEDYLAYANEKKINVIKGGIKEALNTKITPDLIILNHVIEHFNNFSEEINNLYKLCNDKTLVFIETPGLDSLMGKRRSCDILGDLQVAHKFYFSKKTLSYFLSKAGFEILYINNQIQLIMKKSNYSQSQSKKNFYLNTIYILLMAELFFVFLKIKKKLIK